MEANAAECVGARMFSELTWLALTRDVIEIEHVRRPRRGSECEHVVGRIRRGLEKIASKDDLEGRV